MPTIGVEAPERATREWLARVLDEVGLPSHAVVGREAPGGTVLLAVNRGGWALPARARAVSGAGGTLLVWSAAGEDAADPEAVLTQDLAAESGALVSSDLGALVVAARLTAHPPAPTRLKVVGGGVATSGIAARLERQGLLDGGSPWSVRIVAGRLTVGHGREEFNVPSVEALCGALLLLGSRPVPVPVAPPAFVEPGRLESILCPPARVLSEVVSKRVAAVYGLEPGPEHLSRSATEAVRVAAAVDGPVVLKLVRPGLVAKERAGLVLRPIRGAPAVRRAWQRLAAAGVELGPPAALGVLVAPEMEEGPRIWLAMEERPDLGRFVVGGIGDRPGDGRRFACGAPTAPERAATLLARVGIEEGRAALAEAVARFSWLVAVSGDRLAQAALHPVAYDPRRGSACLLDALIAVR